MSWPIRMVPAPGNSPGTAHRGDLQVGDMWFAPYLLEPKYAGHLLAPSPKYSASNAHRPPLVICLPAPSGRVDWHVDGCPWKDGKICGEGWDVSGEPPLITVSPSVSIQGCYHGFIQNGVISDDCEGRKY